MTMIDKDSRVDLVKLQIIIEAGKLCEPISDKKPPK